MLEIKKTITLDEINRFISHKTHNYDLKFLLKRQIRLEHLSGEFKLQLKEELNNELV